MQPQFRKWLSFVVLGIVTLNAYESGPAHGSEPTVLARLTTAPAAHSLSPAANCADVLVIGARGSGETETDHQGLGSRVGAFTALLQTHLVGRSVDVKALTTQDYPALPVGRLLADLITAGNSYFDGLNQGTRSLYKFLMDRQADGTCPDQRYVLAGYSQGAMLTHRVINLLQDRGWTSILRRIDGVVLLADGDRARNTQTQLIGQPAAGIHGVGIAAALGLSFHDITGPLAARTWSACQDNDLVCDFRLHWLDLEFPLLQMPRLADAAIRGKKVHTGDAYQGGHVLNRIAINVANEIRSTPKPMSGQSFTVAAGTPVTMQLQAEVAEGFKLTWRLAAGSQLPDGLLVSSSGIVRGTPSQTASGSARLQVQSSILGVVASNWISTTVNWAPPGAPTIVPPGPVALTGGVGFRRSLQTTDGRPGVWSIASGALPPGVLLDSASGLLAGIPGGSGQQYPVQVRFTDRLGRSGVADLQLAVGAPLPTPRYALFNSYGPQAGPPYANVDEIVQYDLQLGTVVSASEPNERIVDSTSSGSVRLVQSVDDSSAFFLATSSGSRSLTLAGTPTRLSEDGSLLFTFSKGTVRTYSTASLAVLRTANFPFSPTSQNLLDIAPDGSMIAKTEWPSKGQRSEQVQLCTPVSCSVAATYSRKRNTIYIKSGRFNGLSELFVQPIFSPDMVGGAIKPSDYAFQVMELLGTRVIGTSKLFSSGDNFVSSATTHDGAYVVSGGYLCPLYHNEWFWMLNPDYDYTYQGGLGFRGAHYGAVTELSAGLQSLPTHPQRVATTNRLTGPTSVRAGHQARLVVAGASPMLATPLRLATLESSTDGGATWHQATPTDIWSGNYTFYPKKTTWYRATVTGDVNAMGGLTNSLKVSVVK